MCPPEETVHPRRQVATVPSVGREVGCDTEAHCCHPIKNKNLPLSSVAANNGSTFPGVD